MKTAFLRLHVWGETSFLLFNPQCATVTPTLQARLAHGYMLCGLVAGMSRFTGIQHPPLPSTRHEIVTPKYMEIIRAVSGLANQAQKKINH